MKRAVISLSGGLDSTCLALKLLAEGYEVRAYSFFYGQKHNVELKKVKRNIKLWQKEGLPITHQIIDLRDVFSDSNSSLHQGGEAIPHGHYAAENMKSTVVENRNVIFASIIYGKALSWANKVNDSVMITLGLHAGDHCFTGDTQILTPDGLKTVKELKIGDPIYSFDGDTLKMEVDKCIDILEKGTNSEIYKITTTSGTIRLTSLHKVYTVELGELGRSGFAKKFSGKLVKDLHEGDIMISSFKTPQSQPGKDEYIDLEPIVRDALTTISGDYSVEIEGDEIFIINNKTNRETKKFKRMMPAQSFLNIMAWYITEGWTSKQYKNNPRASRFLSCFSQSVYKNLENVCNIEHDLSECGIEVSASKSKNMINEDVPEEVTYQFTSVVSAIMQMSGLCAEDKHIPSWIKEFLVSNPQYIPEFIQTLVAGDGHFDPITGLCSFSSSSFQLISDVTFLVKKMGLYVKYTKPKTKQHVISFGNLDRKSGLVRFGDGAMTKITKIEIENVEEKVYDISVKKNYNFFAGNLGNVLISNSIYPDCRPESQEMAKELFRISNWGSENVDYFTPFIYLDKGDVLKAGLNACAALGFSRAKTKTILRNTHTCYDPDEKGRSCGKCGSCTERLEAFEKCGWKDPVAYQE